MFAVAGFSLVLCLGYIDCGQWKQVERDNFGRRVDAEMLVCEYIEHFCPDPRPCPAAARNHQGRNGLLKSGRWKALLNLTNALETP